MTDPLADLHAALSTMGGGPTSLAIALGIRKFLGQTDDPTQLDDLFALVKSASTGNPLLVRIRSSLLPWDGEASPSWAEQTLANTRARRDRIYDLLKLDPNSREILDIKSPVVEVDAPILVTEKFRSWYTPELMAAHDFYWRNYRSYLESKKGLSPETIEQLNTATSMVVERFADPTDAVAYPSRGLVVGYVQSGKTMNFAGVIAKAIDAGYRLIIVLAGTLDLLRNQTQRRLDMEVVGTENLLKFQLEDHEYLDDGDWPHLFASYGAEPRLIGGTNIIRLTGSNDFQSLDKGIKALDIEKADAALPLYHPTNLYSASARLIVVKKIPARLGKLLKDLEKVGSSSLAAVPALIIDDESDQASINTLDPDKQRQDEERKRRTRTNEQIVEILKTLPRAQYVGYTATPFANAFVDPDDIEDLFPRSYVLNLPRPLGYMGARDFHDLDGIESDDPAMSNKAAFVREVKSPIGDDDLDLLDAIDSFVMAGAIKCFRRAQGSAHSFRHHTMLAHVSHLQADQDQLKRRIETLWWSAGYQAGSGLGRLEALFERFSAISAVRAPESPFPETFEELKPYIGDALTAIEGDGGPVVMVNGLDEAVMPDFEKRSVWSIVVGGTKLSRGYTIEGLTVSYFRRRASAKDTLMQMGRWFGFRRGYEDLVRLYIGVQEKLTGKSGRTINLYDAFEATCLDEEAFRSQLSRYLLPADGSPPITPRQVPLVVYNTMPELRPTSPKKMLNAVLKSENLGGCWVQRTGAPIPSNSAALRSNIESLERLILASTSHAQPRLAVGTEAFSASVAVSSAGGFLDFVRSLVWHPNSQASMNTVIEFLAGRYVDPEVDDWVIVAPRRAKPTRSPVDIMTNFSLTPIERTYTGTRFKVLGVPSHRVIAGAIAGLQPAEAANPELSSLRREHRRGVALVYAAYNPGDESQEVPSVGLEFLPPRNSNPKRAVWSTRDGTDRLYVDQT